MCVYKRVLCEFSGVDAKGDPHIVLMVFDQAIHCADAHLKCEHKAHRKVSARGVCAFTCDMPIPRSDKLCHYKVVSLSDVMCIMSRVAFGALCINDPIANAPTAVAQMRISIQHIGVYIVKCVVRNISPRHQEHATATHVCHYIYELYTQRATKQENH